MLYYYNMDFDILMEYFLAAFFLIAGIAGFAALCGMNCWIDWLDDKFSS